MKFLPKISLFVFIVTLCFFSLTSQTLSAEFSSAYIRLDKLQSDTQTGGTVCARASSAAAGTEDKIAITFPSDFIINNNEANWTVTTSDLPTGTSPWPGIGTAESVTGSTVTFPSNNITNNSTTYCFSFSGTNTLTTSSSGFDKEIIISTKTSGNTTIDSTSYKINIPTSNEVTLNAKIPTDGSDYSINLVKLMPQGGRFGQDTEITYELTYSSKVLYDADITIEAEWSHGHVDDEESPAVEILDYVTNSAGDRDGATPPIINLQSRKITWSIDNFPAESTEKLIFRLKTNANYTGTRDVSFTVTGRLSNEDTVLSSSVWNHYRYNYNSKPQPTSRPNITPTPTPIDRFFFNTVRLNRLTDDTAEILTNISKDSTVTLRYGTAPNKLSQSITSLQSKRSHAIKISELENNTPYFFRLTALDQNGRRITSDIYTFTTARPSTPPKILTNSLIATSEKTILLSPLLTLAKKDTIIIPEEATFELQFTLENRQPAKSVQIIVKDNRVLGLSNFINPAIANTEQANMLEVEPGVYSGRLIGKSKGTYEIYTKINDLNGNITEEKLVNLIIKRRLIVLEQESKKPIENARVNLYLYNPRNRLYEYVSESNHPLKNPSYTQPDGTVNLVLPQGKYRAEITAIGREKTKVDFTISPYAGEDFPTVSMKHSSSLLVPIEYVASTFLDLLALAREYLDTLISSNRFSELNSQFILFSFVTLTLFSFKNRIHLPVRLLPTYLLHHKNYLSKEYSPHKITGTLKDGADSEVLKKADLFLLDKDSKKLLMHTHTDNLGRFKFLNVPKADYDIHVESIDHTPITFHGITTNEEDLILEMHKRAKLASLPANFAWAIKKATGLLFEILLIISFALEALLIYTFGLPTVLPFLLVSLLNLLLWLHHKRLTN